MKETTARSGNEIVPGFIYILLNPAFTNLLKIGMTERCSENRASELSNHTGVPGKFVVAYEEFVEDCALAEKKIHTALDSHRVSRGREFFELKLKDAIRVVACIVRDVNQTTAPSAQSLKHRESPVRSRRGYPDRFLAERIKMFCHRCNADFFVTLLPKETHSFCPDCGDLSYPK